jgi:hypothetical protein
MVTGYLPFGVVVLVLMVKMAVPEPVNEFCDQLWLAPGIRLTP